ncbi:UTP--glucose-1-phosphate uridylyltransferase [Candidatus Peregrinibacteria bacterium CG_4_10_14_0_2_um_filter_38_24]|nr:MAG: UTP--glucose-1-phosphate uridylyltransferase [Candidatus Peregrinibacteria bacterium CG_4_10_14_0_2_um_filter_38_24]PJC38677.1 MAG: UTP--glucose-1-phosphate uridylyltransferase [Candidatus Peregrinibacteria bacterium CG_4_9_14_0_2_um_filter_38_9]
MKIKKAVILAAGLGTRFLPVTKSVPKEMLPIIDKPCIQYLVEEAVASGIKEIIFVINDSKLSIKNYFSPEKNEIKELKDRLKKTKKTAELKTIESIEHLAKFHYITQKEALGDGHAILCAKKIIGKESVAILFGDDIYDSKTPAISQLIKQYEKFKTPIIGLQKIDKKDSKKYGIIAPEKSSKLPKNLYKISSLIEKPTQEKAPSNLAIVGKYIITPELLKTLEKSKSSTKDKELRLIDGMIEYIKTQPIHGLEIEGTRFDTGDKAGFLKATTHFTLKRSDLK